MEVLVLQVFVSLMLVVGSLLLFAKTCRQRDFDHADRLALFPLDEPEPVAPRGEAAVSTPPEQGKL